MSNKARADNVSTVLHSATFAEQLLSLKNNNAFSFIFVGIDVADVAVNNIKVFPWKFKNGFRLHFCRARKHFSLLFNRIKKYYKWASVFLPLITLHATRIFSAPRFMSSVVCVALPYFPNLSHKRHDFREKIIE
jgi:hypothetical protein